MTELYKLKTDRKRSNRAKALQMNGLILYNIDSKGATGPSDSPQNRLRRLAFYFITIVERPLDHANSLVTVVFLIVVVENDELQHQVDKQQYETAKCEHDRQHIGDRQPGTSFRSEFDNRP